MKRFVLFLGLVLVWDALLGQTAEKKTKSYIVNRVAKIYEDYIYNINPEIKKDSYINLKKTYCSDSFKQLLVMVNEEDNKHPDEIGFFDYDIWINSQEYFSPLSVDEIDVARLDDNLAIVTVFLNYRKPIYIELCFERDDWYVDDFYSILSGGLFTSVKDNMQNYVKLHC